MGAIEIFERMLKQIAEEAQSPEDVLRVWITLGQRIGVLEVFPHFKIISYEHEKGVDVVGFVACPSEIALEFLSSEATFNDVVCNECVRALEENKPVRH